METLIDRLRAVRAFRNLPVSALTKIAQIASPPTTYQAGDDGQGEQALLLVVAGKAKVSLLTADGNENILYLLKGGDVDGQAALFVRHPRLARLIKAVYPTTVIRLRHDAFQDLLASSPLLARELLNSFGARLAELEGRQLPPPPVRRQGAPLRLPPGLGTRLPIQHLPASDDQGRGR